MIAVSYLGCYFALFSPAEASKDLEEILTHELGHNRDVLRQLAK